MTVVNNLRKIGQVSITEENVLKYFEDNNLMKTSYTNNELAEIIKKTPHYYSILENNNKDERKTQSYILNALSDYCKDPEHADYGTLTNLEFEYTRKLLNGKLGGSGILNAQKALNSHDYGNIETTVKTISYKKATNKDLQTIVEKFMKGNIVDVDIVFQDPESISESLVRHMIMLDSVLINKETNEVEKLFFIDCGTGEIKGYSANTLKEMLVGYLVTNKSFTNVKQVDPNNISLTKPLEYPIINSLKSVIDLLLKGYGFGGGGGSMSTIKDIMNQGTKTISPMILDLNGDGVKTISITNGVQFDHDNNGFAETLAA